MFTKQITAKSDKEVTAIVSGYRNAGYKVLNFWERRVPNNTINKLIIKVRRWHGEWSGYKSEVSVVMYLPQPYER